VGWDEHLAASSDLRLLGRYAPAWYRLDVNEAPEPKRTRRRSEQQLQLAPRPEPKVESAVPIPESAAVRPELVAPPVQAPQELAPPERASALEQSALFKQQVPVEKRAEVLRALRFLQSRGGAAPADSFAQHMNYPTMRARSLVASLAEKLSLDGEQPLSYDYVGQRVIFDAAKFKALYDEEP